MHIYIFVYYDYNHNHIIHRPAQQATDWRMQIHSHSEYF